MEAQILHLLQALQSNDNTVRREAEEAFTTALSQDPSPVCLTLLAISSSPQQPIAIRQSALLCLKRLVPLHWSAGFESFVGPAVSADAKASIRPNLLELATLDPSSKVRSGAAYTVTQIAAVDYPDEWPNLLDTLYNVVVGGGHGVLGALSLLQELFDDLVTDEQFFAGGVGIITIGHCMKLMADTSIDVTVRTAAAKLYKTCLLQLQNPEVLEDAQKAQVLQHHVTEMITMLTVLLKDTSIEALQMQLRTVLYTISYQLLTEFPEELFEKNAKLALQLEAAKDLILCAPVFDSIVVNEDKVPSFNPNHVDDIDASSTLQNIVIEQLQLLGALNDIPLASNSNINTEQLLASILSITQLPLEKLSDMAADFNVMITEETGVSPDFEARNAVYDYFTELAPGDVDMVFQYYLRRLSEALSDSRNWKVKEAALYCLDALFRHDTDIRTSESLVNLLNSLISLLQDPEPFVRARTMVIIPAFLSKFKGGLGGEFPIKALLECARQGHNDSETLIKAMFLVSFTYFGSFIKLEQLPNEAQGGVLRIIEEVLEEASEDTPSLLTEALTMALKINKDTNVHALKLLWRIANLDSGNVQLVVEAQEALEELLLDVDMASYIAYADAVLPSLLDDLTKPKPDSQYSDYNLDLEFLTVFLNSSPETVPQAVCSRVEPILSKMLLDANDDGILQLGADAYHALITHADPQLFDVNTVLEVLSKFLSPDLSDSAAMNAGSLVVAVLTHFSDNITSILPQILEATTRRLLTSKELSTTSDLLSVLCLMISTDVGQTIAFLQHNDIQRVFNMWLSNFSTISGIDRIRKNCEALTTVFFYAVAHPQEFQFTVDGEEIVNVPGDVIITRSMRKSMKKEYTQVSVVAKIVKLLVGELRDQCAQQGVEPQDLVDAVGEGDDEGWEDVDAIGEDFDTLKGYIDDDYGQKTQDEGLKEYLVGFFKQAAASDDGHFRDIYNGLSDEEKLVLTENIV